MATSISVKNLSKTFKIYEDRKNSLKGLFASFLKQGKTKEYKVLDNINLEIHQGDFIGIVGRNGSGKSTLLKIIAGIYSPDKGGEVSYLGKLIPFLELGVGFNPDLTGRENVYLNGTILGMTLKELKTKFNDIVQFAELENFIDMPVKNYSSGMIVRLGFSIAIQANADIFLLDEVLSVGDANFQAKSISIIQKFKQEGKTIIFVSHDLGSIVEHCNRAILIDQARIIIDGAPGDVVSEYKNLLGIQ